MKLLLINLFIFFLLVFNLPKSLPAKELDAHYKIEWGSINIGSLKWSFNLEGNNYNTSMHLRDMGLLSGLYRFSGNYLSEGKILDGEFVSSRYKQSWKTKKKTREVEITFYKTMVYSLVITPKEIETPRIEYLKFQNLIDPLASFLNILTNSTNNYITIDGRRLYKMSSDIKKEEGGVIAKNIIITDYSNIWTDHKRNDLKYIITKQYLSTGDNFFPNSIKINNKGLVFKLTKL